MSTLVGISISAKNSILFKEATFLETMAKSNLLALDKTGTVTEGKPSVVFSDIKDFDMNLLYSLVSTSNHPISRGVLSYITKEYDSLSIENLDNIKSIEAKGVEASYNGRRLLGGNSAFMRENGIEIEIDSSNSIFLFSIDGTIMAKFELRDKIKDGAREAIKNIKDMGIRVVMLTGDHSKSANSIAKDVGIDEVYSRLLPQDKAEKIDEFHRDGYIVVMAGDGINDTIALASSDIAIAMGAGADVAINISDVVLIDDKIDSIYRAYKISKRTFRAVKENLGFSILYNFIAVPLAVLGFVNPLISALSMSLSSLVVVANSLRIKRLTIN